MAKKEFSFRGHRLKDLQAMSMDEFSMLVTSRKRKSLQKGFSARHRKLLEKIKKVRNGANINIKTHCRDMIIIPEMVGLKIEVHNGKEFIPITIKEEMLGHYLGEFALTRKKVRHGMPGMGATRSSLYVPLK